MGVCHWNWSIILIYIFLLTGRFLINRRRLLIHRLFRFRGRLHRLCRLRRIYAAFVCRNIADHFQMLFIHQLQPAFKGCNFSLQSLIRCSFFFYDSFRTFNDFRRLLVGLINNHLRFFLCVAHHAAAQLLGATPELLPNCLMYGRILLVFQTAFMMQFFFQSFFITSEKPKLGLAFTVLAGLTNIVLDFLLVGVLRGGIVGAASATVISQMVGGIGPMFYFFNRKNSSLLHFVRPKFSAKALGKACANGSSELMTNLSASLVSALYNLQLMKLIGADGVAAYGVLMYVGFIFAAVFIGYAQGCAPIISYHYGAENHDELQNLFRKSITMLAIAGVAMFTSAQLMATPLAKMFVGYDAGLMELTEHALKLYAFSFLLCGFNIFSSAFFTALNNGAISAAISFLRTLVFQVFAVLVLPMVLDIDGIWYAMVFAEAAALLVSAALLVKNRNRYHYA